MTSLPPKSTSSYTAHVHSTTCILHIQHVNTKNIIQQIHSKKFAIKQQIHHGQFRCALKTCYRNLIRNCVLCPVPTVANKENNELRIENNAISGHILSALFSCSRALLSTLPTLVSHYSAFSSVLLTDANVLNCSKHSSLILNSPHSPVKFSSERSSFVLHSSLFAARYSHVSVNLRH